MYRYHHKGQNKFVVQLCIYNGRKGKIKEGKGGRVPQSV